MCLRHSWTFNCNDKRKQIYIKVSGQFNKVQQGDSSREPKNGHSCERVVTKIVFEHGMPEKILTDQGTNFTSEMFKNTCKLLKIEKIQTSAYHPESNGALERSHQTLAEYLYARESLLLGREQFSLPEGEVLGSGGKAKFFLK